MGGKLTIRYGAFVTTNSHFAISTAACLHVTTALESSAYELCLFGCPPCTGMPACCML